MIFWKILCLIVYYLTHLNKMLNAILLILENTFVIPFSFHNTKCQLSNNTERSNFIGHDIHIDHWLYSTLVAIQCYSVFLYLSKKKSFIALFHLIIYMYNVRTPTPPPKTNKPKTKQKKTKTKINKSNVWK